METQFVHPQVGELMLEHTFYEYGIDQILFVCVDTKGYRYLCSCCQLGKEWIIARANESTLINLIDDKITIREAFENKDGFGCMITWDSGDHYIWSDGIPEDALPERGALLELEYEKTGVYRETLRQYVA